MQRVLLTPCDAQKAEFLTPSAFAALQNHCQRAFIPLLGRVRPPTPAEITGVAFPAHSESRNVEWDRKEEEE